MTYYVFSGTLNPTQSINLYHILPPPRDPAVTSRLQKPTLYPRPRLYTKRYSSTVTGWQKVKRYHSAQRSVGGVLISLL